MDVVEIAINIHCALVAIPFVGFNVCKSCIAFKPNGSTTSHSSIKRVIALPGETVQIKDGMIYINGELYLEQKDYPVITNPGLASEELKLEDKEYFVLGDNRNNSVDSRFADVGMVKSSDIEGKVWFVLSPSEHRGFLNG